VVDRAASKFSYRLKQFEYLNKFKLYVSAALEIQGNQIHAETLLALEESIFELN
jgi:hypothetical protein